MYVHNELLSLVLTLYIHACECAGVKQEIWRVSSPSQSHHHHGDVAWWVSYRYTSKVCFQTLKQGTDEWRAETCEIAQKCSVSNLRYAIHFYWFIYNSFSFIICVFLAGPQRHAGDAGCSMLLYMGIHTVSMSKLKSDVSIKNQKTNSWQSQ